MNFQDELPKENIINDTDKEDNTNFFTIPYVEGLAEKIAGCFSNPNTTISYRTINNLNNFIRVHKDLIPIVMQNNLVYCIKCLDCPMIYIGQTKRHLSTRIRKHMINKKKT